MLQEISGEFQQRKGLMESEKVMVLDGGFSNELSKRCSYDVDKEPLWTAKALLTDTDAVVQTHLEYLKAGADIIETATYQATLKGLQESLNLSLRECEEAISNSVSLAENAVKQYKSQQDDGLRLRQDAVKSEKIPLVAGSVGPYGVYLHDGSEYTGSYMDKVSEADIVELHSRRLEILSNRKVDILALETMPSLSEVKILLKHLEKQGNTLKVWVSFTLQEADPSRTVRGDLITDAFKTVSKYSFVWGFGTNCVNPKNVSEFLRIVSEAKRESGEIGQRIRLMAYPNVGRTWISGKGWSEEDVPSLAKFAKEWLELGAKVIGGCCQVGPDDIKKLRSLVDEWNSSH